jgi:hypothetical protein
LKKILAVLFCVSVIFGFFKQAKVALRSIDNMRETKTEAGADARALKPPSAPLKILYVSDRTDREGQNYYDAQYGFAPLLISDKADKADWALLEFTEDRLLKDYCAKNHWRIVARRGRTAFAEAQRESP